MRHVSRIAASALALGSLSLGCFVPTHAGSVPDGRWFWVQNSSGWQHIYAQALSTRSHVTVYAPPSNVAAGDATRVARMFENRIYPTNTRIFGRPRRLRSVSILLAPLDGITLGYFDQADLQPFPSPTRHSNRGNVIYVRPPAEMPDRNKLADTGEVVAHEFQHLINFRLRVMDMGLVPQESWLNEGMSFYAQLANHFFTPRDRLKVRAAAASPGWRVTSMADSTQALLKHGRVAYGRAGLFTTYLANRFGAGFIRDLLSDPHPGLAGVDDVVRSRHLSAADVFADWGVAALLGQKGIYGYGSMSRNLRVTPRTARPPITSFPFDSDSADAPLSVAPWSHLYLRFNSRYEGTLSLSVQTPPNRSRLALVLRERGIVAPLVQWLHPDSHGVAVLNLPHFGTQIYEANLVVAETGTGKRADRLHVKADLVDVGDNNGVA